MTFEGGSSTSGSGKRTSEDASETLRDSVDAKFLLSQVNQRKLRAQLQGLVSPAILERVLDLIAQHPLWMGSKSESVSRALEYHGFGEEEARDIAMVIERCAPSNVESVIVEKKRSRPLKRGTRSLQENGRAMKRTCVDHELGLPIDEGEAEIIWRRDDWHQEISRRSGGPEKLMAALIRTIRVDNCSLNISVEGHQPSVCGNFKPDAVAWLKGWSMTPYSTCFLLCLKSSTGGKYDSDAACGTAFLYGKVLLQRAGPLRKCIVVGVSDLKEIRWFRIMLESEQQETYSGRNSLHPYVVQQSIATKSVRQSLCNFLMRSDLGINLTDPIFQMLPKDTWQITRHLGRGATSNVYEAMKDTQVLVVKVPNGSNVDEGDDEQYLQQLKGIDGVPILVEKVGSILCMQPIGEPVVDIISIGHDVEFAGFVDVLYHAHQRRIVHRDIRPENIVIAESLQKKTKKLFLVDWGFAAQCGVPRAYSGGIVTASDNILDQCKMGGGDVAYSESDDLVALVRCIYLLCYPNQYDIVEECKHSPWALLKFWKGRVQEEGDHWKRAEECALENDYEGLKKFLPILHYTGLLARMATE